MNRRELGQLGETLAAQFLQAKGYTIRETNYRRRSGEIDLIARDNEELVFIEVRTRQKKYGEPPPTESVTWRKQQKIMATAERYLNMKKHLWDTPWRIDVIGIEFDAAGQFKNIEHIEDAVEE